MRYASDVRTLAFLAIYALSIVAGYACIDVFSLWQAVVFVSVQCAFAFSVAVITHNTVHVPMFRSRSLNRAAQGVLSFLFGNSVSVFVRGHNFSHHRHTQTAKDLMRTTKARFRWNLLNQALFLFIVARGMDRSNRGYIARERALNTQWYQQYRFEKWTVLIGSVALLALDWRAALAFVLIPRLFGLWGISGINYVQHDGCDPAHRYNHSRNLVGRFSNWFLFNNGYHTLHHHRPNLHWSLLPEVHAQEIAPHNDPALNQRWAALYLWRAYVWPGRRVRFDGQPVVLGPSEPDQEWLPTSIEMAQEISIGAAGSDPRDA